MKKYAIVDVEISLKDNKIHDIGAIRYDGAVYHNTSKKGLYDFLSGIDIICGHNIVHHDAKYLFDSSLSTEENNSNIYDITTNFNSLTFVDTLYE